MSGIDVLKVLEEPQLLLIQEQRIADALRWIKNESLWFGWSSFEEYCNDRWGIDTTKIKCELVADLRTERPNSEFPETGGIYFVQPEGRDVVKIGVAREFESRIAALQTSSPERLIVLGVLFGQGFDREQEIHNMFAADRRSGEWFTLTKAIRDYQWRHGSDLPRKKPGTLTVDDVLRAKLVRIRDRIAAKYSKHQEMGRFEYLSSDLLESFDDMVGDQDGGAE